MGNASSGPMNALIIGIALWAVSGFVSCLPRTGAARGTVFSLLAAAGSVCAGWAAVSCLLSGAVFQAVFPFAGSDVELRLDALSAFFLLLVCFGGALLAVSFAAGSAHRSDSGGWAPARFVFFGLLLSSIGLVFCSFNTLAFLFSWEMMSLSSFLLVVAERDSEDALKAGVYYLVAMHAVAVLLIAGLFVLASAAGSYDFGALPAALVKNPGSASLAFVLLLCAFGAKAGLFPFHTWLPRAHPAAPFAVSALMSGVMIKTGLYGLMRIASFWAEPALGCCLLLFAVSALSAIYGAFFAAVQKDVKKMLAYCSVENVGLIGLGVSVGLLGQCYDLPALSVLGYGAACMQTFSHGVAKMLLFASAEGIYRVTHTKNIEHMGGVLRAVPWTGGLFLVGALAVCGLPPFAGFAAEFTFVYTAVDGMRTQLPVLNLILLLSVGVVAFSAALSVTGFVKNAGAVLLGSPRRKIEHRVRNMPLPGRLVWSLLGLVLLLGGVLPQYFARLAFRAVSGVFVTPATVDLVSARLTGALCYISMGISGALLAASLVWALRTLLLEKNGTRLSAVWACGFTGDDPRRQYGTLSLSSPLVTLVDPLARPVVEHRPAEGYFPSPQAGFDLRYPDWIERNVVGPVWALFKKMVGLLNWIQSGSTQRYLVYGLIFLILAVFWILEAVR